MPETVYFPPIGNTVTDVIVKRIVTSVPPEHRDEFRVGDLVSDGQVRSFGLGVDRRYYDKITGDEVDHNGHRLGRRDHTHDRDRLLDTIRAQDARPAVTTAEVDGATVITATAEVAGYTASVTLTCPPGTGGIVHNADALARLQRAAGAVWAAHVGVQ
jgi:hypothetical protein